MKQLKCRQVQIPPETTPSDLIMSSWAALN
jgi:hypothetical protein